MTAERNLGIGVMSLSAQNCKIPSKVFHQAPKNLMSKGFISCKYQFSRMWGSCLNHYMSFFPNCLKPSCPWFRLQKRWWVKSVNCVELEDWPFSRNRWFIFINANMHLCKFTQMQQTSQLPGCVWYCSPSSSWAASYSLSSATQGISTCLFHMVALKIGVCPRSYIPHVIIQTHMLKFDTKGEKKLSEWVLKIFP